MTRARAEGGTRLLLGIGLAEGALPFAPIVEAIRPLVRVLEHDGDAAADPAAPRRAPRWRWPASSACPPAGARHRRGHRGRSAPEWARGRAYEAFLELLGRWASGDRWSSRSRISAGQQLHQGLLAFLVRNAQQDGLLLVTFAATSSTGATRCCPGWPRWTGPPASSASSCTGCRATVPPTAVRMAGTVPDPASSTPCCERRATRSSRRSSSRQRKPRSADPARGARRTPRPRLRAHAAAARRGGSHGAAGGPRSAGQAPG